MMGHLNPVLGVRTNLTSEGHDVVGMSSTYLRERIEAIGARFRSFLPEADFDIAFPPKRLDEVRARGRRTAATSFDPGTRPSSTSCWRKYQKHRAGDAGISLPTSSSAIT